MSLLAWVYGTGDANVSYEAATISQMIDCCCAEVHTCRRIQGQFWATTELCMDEALQRVSAYCLLHNVAWCATALAIVSGGFLLSACNDSQVPCPI